MKTILFGLALGMATLPTFAQNHELCISSTNCSSAIKEFSSFCKAIDFCNEKH